jgi:hypothetical protein
MNIECSMSNIEVKFNIDIELKGRGYWRKGIEYQKEDVGFLLQNSTFGVRYSILYKVFPALIDQQFGFKKFCNFYYRIIVFAGSFLNLVRVN